MLIEFRAQNHRSLREEQAISFAAVKPGDDPRPRTVAGHDESLLPVLALYGANASGKSNMLAALAFFRDAITHSHTRWPEGEGVPVEPFAWGKARTEDSEFRAVFLIDGVKYEYGFCASAERFTEEWLFAWPNGRKQAWFEREGDAFEFNREHLRGENRLVEKVTRPNSLFLAAAAQNKHEQLTPIHRWLRSIRALSLGARAHVSERWAMGFLERNRPSALEDDEGDAERRARLRAFRQLVRMADFGIVDVKLRREHALTPRKRAGARVLLQHEEGNDESWLSLDEESHGTQTLFVIAPVVIQALREGGVVVIDELEASLHPLLALHIIQLFNSRGTNPKNAQLLFTTHDTNLLGTTLGEPPLRRDQVWLSEKSDEGTTRVYPLSDYSPRNGENLERGYLQGRYGAIPFIGKLPAEGAEIVEEEAGA